MPAAVVVVADSRGRGIGKHLRQSTRLPEDTKIHTAELSGATIETLHRNIRHLTREVTSKYPGYRVIVTLLGGICNFTTRSSAGEVLYSHPADLDTLKRAIDDIIVYCKDRGYYLIVSNIIPACLTSARKYRRTQGTVTPAVLELQQKQLETDINTLNKYISETTTRQKIGLINSQKEIETPTRKRKGRSALDKKTTITIRHYSGLHDGVHFNPDLKNRIFNRVEAAIKYQLAPRAEPEAPTESEEEETNWNFKRTRSSRK